MSNIYPPVPPRDPDLSVAPPDEAMVSGGGAGKVDVAKEEAARLGEETAAAGQRVAGVAREEASKVAAEVKTQTKDLLQDAQTELNEQASTQQRRIASALHSASDELNRMANSSEQHSMATDLVQQAASRAGSVASWLDERDPGSLLEEVRQFARRRPGAFICIAAGVGILAGRLTRSMASDVGTPAREESTPRTMPMAEPTAGTPIYDATLGETGGVDGLNAPAASSFEQPATALDDYPEGQERL